jgi:signal transduction histidine kinase/ligand-binding sensor domain-containing protein
MRPSLIFLFVCQAFVLLAQNTFERISSKDGIPSNSIHAICQDADGYLWLGTRRGLVRYDGHDFRSNLSTIGNGLVFSITQNGNELVAWANDKSDNRGLYQISKQGFDVKLLVQANFFDENPTNDHFENLFADSQQRIWAADQQNAKFYNLKTKKLSIFKITQTLLADNYAAIFYELPNRNILIMSEKGIFSYRSQFKKISSLQVRNFCASPNPSQLFVVLINGELGVFDAQTNEYKKIATPAFGKNLPTTMATIDANTLWIGTSQGIYKYHIDNNRLESFEEFTTEPTNVRCIFKDSRSHSFWFGTDRGLFRYREQKKLISNIKIPANLVKPPVVVKRFLEDGNNLWIGLSHSGLLQYSPQSQVFKLHTIPASVAITALEKGADGELWVGTSKGLYRFVSQQFELVIPHIMVIDVAIDGKNRLWVVPFKAPIQVYEAHSMKPLTLWKPLPMDYWTQNLFNDLKTDTQGRMWLAAWFPKGYGAVFYDEPKQNLLELSTINRDIEEQFIGDFFINIYSCTNGEMLMSGYGGYNRFGANGRILERFGSQKDTLADIHCSYIAQDAQRRVWVATEEGLHSIDDQTKKVNRLTEYDGLTNNAILNGFLLSKTQQIWIGQANGFDRIDLHNLHHTVSMKDTLKLSHCWVANQERLMDWRKPIVLERDENTISLSFSKLDYEPIYKSQYRYRFVGSDSTWVNLGSNPTVSLINLKPDDYILEMQAGDIQGNWDSTRWQGVFTIQAAFYETRWFYVLLVLGSAAAFYGLYRFRLQKIQQLQHIRERISRDLHDEVGSTVSGIAIMGTMLNQQMTQQTPAITTMTERVIEDAQRIGSTLDDIIWSVHPQNDSVSSLLARMKRHAAQLLEAKNIDYDINTKGENDDVKVMMEQRHDIFLIFKEAVNNLIKYAEATKAVIDIKFDKKYLQMSIADNGKGFDATQNVERNGLKNMYKRTETWNGEIQILSKKNEGTTIQVKIPMLYA